MTQDEADIRQLVQRWFDATRAGDLETVAGLMTEDVVFMVPGQEAFGREAFLAAAQSMQGVRIEGASTVQEVEVQGNLAWVRGQVNVAVTPWHGGVMKHMAGSTLSIFRRGPDGAWRLARDANLLTPGPAESTPA
ncbi:YybH family protein [Falsiroseomonas sp.]|uniref:YybH family protein n=1 Tax=Falsiroseomonas sp. TaxID=2870721 RepID=UPI003F70E4AC